MTLRPRSGPPRTARLPSWQPEYVGGAPHRARGAWKSDQPKPKPPGPPPVPRQLSEAARTRGKARINLEGYWEPGHHRSGWRYALDSLRTLHNPDGVFFDGFLEKKFAWGADPGERHNGWRHYDQPWVGFMHNPPNIPEWFNLNHHSPLDILGSPCWQRSMDHCCGIFTLSRYLQAWLQPRVRVPVCSTYHPTEIPERQFSLRRYRLNPRRTIVQVGWWLRRFRSIYELRVPGFHKMLLSLGEHWMDTILRHELQGLTGVERESVESVGYLDNAEYDALLSENLVLLHLYDSSANNALIECIARGTPALVNPLPAVVEYLGADYPFYFHTLEEAAFKAENLHLVAQTHEYLRAPSLRDRLSGEHFRRTLIESEIYQHLPDTSMGYQMLSYAR